MPKHFPVHGEVHTQNPGKAPIVIDNCSLSSIAFHNNTLPLPPDPKHRYTIRDVSIFRCEHWACSAYGAVFEDVTVTDIRGGGMAPSFLWGCVFSRVTLRGWISGILIRDYVDPDGGPANRAFAASNAELYRSIEWALDIREAQFSFFLDLPGIPTRLIRRNPDVHFVLNRESAARLATDRERYGIWSIAAEELLRSSHEDVVIVVGGRGAKLKEDLQRARELRDQGFLS